MGRKNKGPETVQAERAARAAARIGSVRGLWTITAVVGRHHDGWLYRGQCVCGATKVAPLTQFGRGRTQSCVACGQLRRIAQVATHRRSKDPMYHAWQQMHQRCANPKAKSYHLYGGRGIKVCWRWHEFENFLTDMGDRPEGMTLDRKDTDGDYTPKNCRWATRQEQTDNRRAPPSENYTDEHRQKQKEYMRQWRANRKTKETP